MKKTFGKVTAGILAGALAFSSFPGIPDVKAAGLQPAAHYDMSYNGNQLLDISGNGKNAELVSATAKDFTAYEEEQVLQFHNKQYAKLPQGIVTGTDNNFTVEITLATQTKAPHWAWCIGQGEGTWAGNNVGNYVFVNPYSHENNRQGKILSGIKVGSVQTDEKRLPVSTKNLESGYSTVSLVGDGRNLTLYLDGEQVSQVEHDYKMADVIPAGNVLGYIGKSLFSEDALLTANVGDIKFYDEALSQDEVKTSMPSNDRKGDMIAADATKAMLGTNGSADQITTDLNFPTTVDGISVTWGESSEPDIIDVDGTVTAPEKDTQVTIPLSFKVGGENQDKAVTVTVKAGDDAGSNEGELVASYDMSHEGNALVDISGKGNDAILHDVAEDDFYTFEGEKVWKLDNQGYAALPAGMIDGENFTVQATVTTQTDANHWLITIGDGFGTWDEKNVGNYIFVNPSEKDGKFRAGIKTGMGGDWKEQLLSCDTGVGKVNGYGTVTLVGRGGKISLYLDGRRVSSLTQDKTIQDVLPKDSDVMGYIGKSLYTKDSLLKANISDVKIWSKALSKQEIEEELPDTDATVNMLMADIYETVKGNNTSLDSVTENLVFPAKVDQVALNWGTWENTDIISEDGEVHAAVGKETKIEIPVSFELNGQTYAENLDVTVLPLDVDAELKEALDALDIPNKEDVRGNITLPEESENGIPITWSTDRDDIVNVEKIPSKVNGYDDTPAGTVTRPKSDTVVTMTGSLTLAGTTVSKDIKIKVKAAPKELAEEDYTDYFFTYFAGEGYADGEQIYFAASEDGLNWTDLNKNNPVLTSTLGEKGVRDPFIIRSPEGDKFYMIATDLKIYGNGDWNAAQNSGSQALMVWESTDLVNWSDQRMVTVSAAIGAGCTWAPEATYDELTGEYVVYWASRTPAVDGKQRLYYAKTRDFYTFTEPKVWIDMDQSAIDSTVLKENGTYYRFTKNEGGETNSVGAKTKSIFMEKSNQLLGDYSHIPSDSLNNNQWVEGPTIFKFNKDDQKNGKYCLLVDNFGGIGYYPLITDNLESGDFHSPEKGTYKMPSRARHGTPIRVTKEEYNRVMQQWGGMEVDKSPLQKAVEEALEANLKESDYTPESWKEYKEALDEAQSLLGEEGATAAQISQAVQNLDNAKAALVPANREKLEKLAAECGKLNSEDYTEETWKHLQEALTSAEAVLKDSAATPGQIQDALNALQEAKDHLKKVSTGTDPEDPQKPEEPESGTGGNGNVGNNMPQNGSVQNGKRAARTGDSSNPMLPVAAGSVALVIAVAVLKKKKF